MSSDELRQHVQAAIREEWPAFAARHPHLAEAIEESFWIDTAADSIDSDPAYHAAMNNAQLLGTVLDQGPVIVRDFVQRWLKRLG